MKKYLSAVLSLTQLAAGTALTAAAFGMIVIPCGFTAGGVTGLSKIIAELMGLSLSATVLVMNLSLLLLGLICVSRSFAAKTVGVSILFPAMLEFFSRFPLSALTESPVLAVLTSGLMLGFGAGIIIRSGASSGGFDVLAVILKRKAGISVALVLNLCDAAVIAMQAMRQPFTAVICGVSVITISAAIVGGLTGSGVKEHCGACLKAALCRVKISKSDTVRHWA